METLEYKTSKTEWNKIKLNLEDKIEKVFSQLAYEKMCDIQNLSLFETTEHGNKLIQFKRKFNFEQKVYKFLFSKF